MAEVKVWGAEGIDENTIRQAELLSRHPAVVGHVALMPDAHVGIGATIGSVIATKDTIIPSTVGVDIGCGMIAVKTSLVSDMLPLDMQPLVNQFGRSIPVGLRFGSHTTPPPEALSWLEDHPVPERDGVRNRASEQLGTLGGGNHFLEVCLDQSDGVWIVLHSGSRGIGNQLAQHHIKIARELGQDVEDKNLGYFEDGMPEFSDYISDMLWAQAYAWQNRVLMMDAAIDQLRRFVGDFEETLRINCHHNFAQQEGDVWITRKGAIRALPGDGGVIPGSMGTDTYIVEGLGNSDAYNSSPHGAGRRLSRGQAKRELTVESLSKAMGERAWQASNAIAFLDEHPDAYKDISAVMEASKTLVRPVQRLHQIVNYKGA